MHNARKLFATSMIAAACAVPAALLLSATASADPVPAPPMPAMPNIPFLSGFSPANAPAMLQGLASAFTGAATPAAAAAPAAPAPAATASVTLPQAPVASLAAPLATAPAAVPAAAAPAQGLVPTAEVQIPQVANSPLPLPKELNFPGDLASLMPPGLPLAGLLPKSPTPAVAATAPLTAVAPLTATAPVATAAVPATPALTGLGELNPLMFPVSGLP